VQVNLSYDSLGSFGTSAALFNGMKAAGIAVMEYRPLIPSKLVCPGRLAIAITARYSWSTAEWRSPGATYQGYMRSGPSGIELRKAAPTSEYWRDTDIEVQGPAVAQFQKIFITQWNYQKGPSLKPCDYFRKLDKRGGQIVQVISSVPERYSFDLCHFDIGGSECQDQHIPHRCLFRPRPSDAACFGTCGETRLGREITDTKPGG
jgi:cardiolipin synthase A/B